MLLNAASDKAKPMAGVIEGDLASRALWSQARGTTSRTLRIFLGDEVEGPLVWLMSVDPTEPAADGSDLEFRPAQAHYHRSPTFRVALGPQPRQFKFDQNIYGQHDFIALDSNRFYQDPFSAGGGALLLVLADRRGFQPTNRKLAGMSSDEIIAKYAAQYGDFGAAMAEVNLDDSNADLGIYASFGVTKAGRLRGSLRETSAWNALADGSRVSAIKRGTRPHAPLLIMSENTPGVVESAPCLARTDMFRFIVSGSCRIGDREYGPGSFIAVEAGRKIDAVVHGDAGSTQLLLVADGRNWRPECSESAQCQRQDRIADIVRQATADRPSVTA